MKKWLVAFAGFRHAHIMQLYNTLCGDPGFEIVGCCEEDRGHALPSAVEKVAFTHDSLDVMLREIPCDIVAIGDVYGKRGSMAIRALKAGRHVFCDKPLCTSLAELNEIEAIASDRNLSVGCMFEMRFNPRFLLAKELIAQGKIGRLCQIQINGQHPLCRGSRPGWYFEKDRHGGTLNDIAGHAVDILPSLTGLKIRRFIAAREWRCLVPENEFMTDAAQFMLELDNGCGVVGDVSYNAFGSPGYSLHTYWRFNIWGTEGMIELNCIGDVRLWSRDAPEPRIFTVPDGTKRRSCFESFMAELSGTPDEFTTKSVLESSRLTLELQALAETAPAAPPHRTF